MESIEVSADHEHFAFSKSKAKFSPRGFNYDRDYKMRLLEDYWDTEWETVVEDFREMKQLGANVVRIHLQVAKFMEGPDKPNRRSLSRLKQLLNLAETTGLYLDITGLGCYRKADVPAWFEHLNEQDRWTLQANFWRAISKSCSKSPRCFLLRPDQ
ncbi:MAG: Glycerophosphoryl diester phosphodiesterase [Verrucomicrobiales bacterium]|nr:Glycerophosphoryl diester phosphodiesterase [Verrucomicrobiales bacterium]